ncbi:hypothetical protein C7J88_06385 [Staphylococcus muscae]|uniref:LPXTG-motif cell wall anchor domain-containing protein n=1 Tax=Staphylococcus muscae TaxID=1294 RepID=A0A240CAU0_9STAP|nr:YSIRK-type signal peptide-containing protein [Staphylococcus muscae]AVQ33817.1 hypothetical protein C7J88_06385 [Staphylococcus muscae]PNZ03942.1 hypothetical protein CD131_05385 [Staphylococcus muscae]GGA94757.1 hypothetical protein GCM10007183_18650 [Staphylococcus muscae]SNW04356.1 LPXTG-motif cell wall anchor domain-containing protein [Staphylococcus muscae]
MANKKSKSSTRFDFLPNKQNKYSIRKFTVGTASILVGATLVFGAYNDAQAEELDGKTTEAASTTDEEASLDEATATEADAPVAEETTTEETTTEETAPAEETTTEEAATEEAADTPAVEEEATEETAPVEETTTEEATTEEATSATPVKPANEVKAADPVETPAATTEAVAPAETTPATTATETTPETPSNTPAEVPATDIETVQDETTAADYLATEKNISTEEANKIASNLNANLTEVTPEALQQAIVDYLANEQNKYNVDGTLAAVREETALTNEDVVTEEPVAATMLRSVPTATRAADDTVATSTRAQDSQLQKDAQTGAIYAPGTEGQKQSYAGKAWVYREGNISSFNDKEPLANAKVYLQWVNGKGFVSPVYYTTTNPDGSYVFDLS